MLFNGDTFEIYWNLNYFVKDVIQNEGERYAKKEFKGKIYI